MIAWSSIFRSPTDRTHLAKPNRQKLGRRDWILDIVRQSHHVADSLKGCASQELVRHTEYLAMSLRKSAEPSDPKLLALAGGAAIEAVRRVLGLTLFDVQLEAGIAIACGAVAEMQTGEGKTLAGVLPTYVHALQGRGVHVATTNAYLADRDHQDLTLVFRMLGLTTGLLADDADLQQTQSAYAADITFGSGHTFGFDFLRDQLVLRESETQRLGVRTLQRVSGNSPESQLRQRPLYAAIVDEIDHVLIDDAVSPLILSSSSQGSAPDEMLHQQAAHAAAKLQSGSDYTAHAANRSIELTEPGFDALYDNQPLATHFSLVRPWHEYVVLALRASHFFQRDVHYVVRGDEVQIVDESTGRIFEDRTWSEGLHQAVLAREGLPVTAESAPLAKITRQRFYRHYELLAGMTGTAAGCEKEFASVYGLAVARIPLRNKSKRSIQPPCLINNANEKYQAIAQETRQVVESGRAVLIGTLNIEQSHAIAAQLDRCGLSYQLLNGIQDAAEAEIIAAAGQAHAITVATNLAGRGTDIKLDDAVRESGGLHVIVSEHHALARVDRQLIGRCARCGDPGSARVFMSGEDDLFCKQAPWISRAISRNRRRQSDQTPITKQINRLQTEMQAKATSVRWQMLQVDRENESLLNSSGNLSGCWQM